MIQSAVSTNKSYKKVLFAPSSRMERHKKESKNFASVNLHFIGLKEHCNPIGFAIIFFFSFLFEYKSPGTMEASSNEVLHKLFSVASNSGHYWYKKV
jgi:hypothetical protein